MIVYPFFGCYERLLYQKKNLSYETEYISGANLFNYKITY